MSGDVPDATTIGRFRAKLVEHDLWEALLGEINRQLEAQHIIMTEGRINIIDATPIEAAYSFKATRDKLERFGIDDRVQRKGYRGHPLSQANTVRNDEIAIIRAGGERPFATYKSRYGLARTRLLGLARNLTFYDLAAIAHNIQKGGKFLTRYGLPELEPTG